METSERLTGMSIQKKLILIMLLIGLLPALIVSLIAYVTISNALVQKTANQLTSAVTEQAQKVDNLLQARQEETTDLTNQYNIQNALQQYKTSGGAVGGKQLRTLLSNDKILNPSIQAIYVVGLKGKTIATTVNGDNGKQFNPTDYAIPDGQQTSLSIREDGWDSVDKLYITTIVNVDKTPVAYLRVIFYTDDIVAMLQDYTGLGSTGETLVAKQDATKGNTVSLFPLRFDSSAALQTKLNSLQLFTAYSGSYKTATDYRGHEVMISVMPLSYGNWTIATKIDSDEALAQITQLRNVLLIIAALTSILVFVAASYFANFFTKPIFKIIEVAKRIGRGDFSAHIEMARRDEIGALAENIEHMGSNLQKLIGDIEAQRNRLEIVLNSTTESIFAINSRGVIVTANQATAEMTGLPISTIVGKLIQDVFVWQRAGHSVSIDYSSPATKTYDNIQYTNHAGVVHYVKLIVAHIVGEQADEAPQFIITIHDETKSRELEAMKVDFVSMAAHELRTPLAAIRGYLELIMFKTNHSPENDGTEKYLHQAFNSTNELSGLINNLLDVTRIERGTLAISLEKVDLAAGAKQAVEDARFSAEDKQIALNYSGPAENCFVTADHIAIHEVMNNLISNAIKYTNNGGNVNVSLQTKDTQCIVSVRDSGIGIPKSAQPHIFTKFYRAQSGLNSSNTGTGLGLFISKSIIERHNGMLSFTSDEGVGSTFTFSLPAFDEKQSAQSHAISQTILTKNGGQKRGWITKNINR